MPEGPDGKTIIIVKKVSGHGGHHGGSWKVAYADFVTAMMCLFMVLWLVNSAAEPTRQRIASYFRKPGVFQKGSGTPLESGGAGILPDTFAPPAEKNSQIRPTKRIYDVQAHSGKVREYFDLGDGKNQQDLQLKRGGNAPDRIEGEGEELARAQAEQELKDVEELIEELKKALSEGSGQDSKLLGTIDIKVDQRGLLIEIMDTEKTSMFQLGSANIVEDARNQLKRIADILVRLPNPIDIEGHTDGRPYRGKNADKYDNWNLSMDRANAARRFLQDAGMKSDKIARVVGYADQRLKLAEDPLDASNRRITVSMRFTEQAQKALAETKTVETKAQPIGQKSSGAESAPPKPAAGPKSAQGAPAAAGEATEGAGPAAEQPEAQEEPSPGQLRVEVQTTLPEGAILRQSDTPQARPSTVEKDKIFGRGNSFFDD